MREDPDLPIVHKSLGRLAYYQQDWATAETEFSLAAQLHSTNCAAYFFDASSHQMRRRRTNIDDAATVALLENAIHMNPQFAPAYAALSSSEHRGTALAAEAPLVDQHAKETQYAVEGTISSADCASRTGGKVILKVNRSGLRFKVVDIKQLQSPRETRIFLTMHQLAPIGRAAAPGGISTS
jgi:hypothetical protein